MFFFSLFGMNTNMFFLLFLSHTHRKCLSRSLIFLAVIDYTFETTTYWQSRICRQKCFTSIHEMLLHKEKLKLSLARSNFFAARSHFNCLSSFFRFIYIGKYNEMSKGSHDANIAMPFNNIQVSALDSSTSVHHSCVVWCGEGSDWEVRDKVTTTRKKNYFYSQYHRFQYGVCFWL